VLSKSFEKYGADVRIIERCCRCVRFAIRCLGRNSISLLEPLVSLVQQITHACFLRWVKVTKAALIFGLVDFCQWYYSENYEQVSMKFTRGFGFGSRMNCLDFGGDLVFFVDSGSLSSILYYQVSDCFWLISFSLTCFCVVVVASK